MRAENNWHQHSSCWKIVSVRFMSLIFRGAASWTELAQVPFRRFPASCTQAFSCGFDFFHLFVAEAPCLFACKALLGWCLKQRAPWSLSPGRGGWAQRKLPSPFICFYMLRFTFLLEKAPFCWKQSPFYFRLIQLESLKTFPPFFPPELLLSEPTYWLSVTVTLVSQIGSGRCPFCFCATDRVGWSHCNAEPCSVRTLSPLPLPGERRSVSCPESPAPSRAPGYSKHSVKMP